MFHYKFNWLVWQMNPIFLTYLSSQTVPQSPVHHILVKILIPLVLCPLMVMLIFRVIRVCHNLQKLFISGYAAHIFRRSTPFTHDPEGIVFIMIINYSVNGYFMLPVVPVIITIKDYVRVILCSILFSNRDSCTSYEIWCMVQSHEFSAFAQCLTVLSSTNNQME